MIVSVKRSIYVIFVRDGMLHIFYCALQSGVFLKIKGRLI